MSRSSLFFVLALASPALATTTDCPDLTTIQRWAGYLSWLGLFKGIGVVILASGFIFLTWGILARVILQLRILLEVIAYIVSVAFIAAGWWIEADYQTWSVMTGCILFASSVFASLWIHDIKGDNPKPLAALFMVVWGIVAIFYNMPEVGVLAMLALVTLLNFTVVVSQACYAFGYEEEEMVPSGTLAALVILVAFTAIEILTPTAPAAVTVFKMGAFWVSSFVAFLGLLIMSSRYYSKENGSYGLMQIVTVLLLLGFTALGMTFNISALAGMAGTFFVFYLASKPMEVTMKDRITVGIMLIISGSIIFGAYWLAMQNLDVTAQYLTFKLH